MRTEILGTESVEDCRITAMQLHDFFLVLLTEFPFNPCSDLQSVMVNTGFHSQTRLRDKGDLSTFIVILCQKYYSLKIHNRSIRQHFFTVIRNCFGYKKVSLSTRYLSEYIIYILLKIIDDRVIKHKMIIIYGRSRPEYSVGMVDNAPDRSKATCYTEKDV